MESSFSELDVRQITQHTDPTLTLPSQTDGLVEELVWRSNLEQRTTAVVTISFNVLAALLIITSILFDMKKGWNRGAAVGKLSKIQFLSNVRPAETFPLVISTSIVAQGVIFLGVQGTGLRTQQVDQCRAISQVVWPASWIVAYSLLVFGIEVACRGFQKKRFHPRSRFTVLACWSVVLTMLIATWVPSQVYKNPKNDCSASLLSWAMPWADVALFLNSTLLFLYLLTGSLIAYQLTHTTKIDRNERMAASTTVYYLAIGFILMSAVLPFWARIVLRESTHVAARIATIALNIFGLLTGLLYVILRSNAKHMAFRPVAASREKKQERRPFGSPDLNISKHIRNPIYPRRSYSLDELILPSEGKSHSKAHALAARALTDPNTARGTVLIQASPTHQIPRKSLFCKPPPISHPSCRAPPIPSVNDPLLTSLPTFERPPQILRSESPAQSFKPTRYNLFPQCSASVPTIATNQAHAPEEYPVVPPEPLFFNRKNRNTSKGRSATVQIGMRLSPAALEAEVAAGVGRSVTYPPVTERLRPSYLRYPSQLTQRSLNGAPNTVGPLMEMKPRARDSSPHEILFRLNSNEELSTEPLRITGSTWPKPLEDLVSPTRRVLSWPKFHNPRMKSLPPIPAMSSTTHPTSSHRASFPEPRTPIAPMRAAQEGAASSMAPKGDEQWPLNGFDMIPPNNPYIRHANPSWI